MITTNQTFPYLEESLTLQFSPRETAASVVAYLALNGVLPTVVSLAGAVVAKPAEYDGDMLIKWVVPQHDADGNALTQVVDGVTVPVTYTITAPWFTRDTASLDLTIPVGCTLETLDWLEPELQTIPIRWVTNKGQKYFPITHVDAVIDGNGNKVSSVIEWCREEVEDCILRMESMEAKLMKEVTTYGTISATATDTPDANGYRVSPLLTLYIDDTLHIPADPNDANRKVTLVKEDGTVIGQYPLPLDYTATEDAAFYIYTETPLDPGINYTTVTLASRAGGGTNVSFLETNNMLTITDNDNSKTYTVAKANTFVKADGTTIKATTSADGISKTISVSDELQGAIYDKTTGALRHKSLTDSNTTVGRNSVAFGDSTKTSNASEISLGQYNTSHDNGDATAKTTFFGDNEHTALSLGVGLSNTNRINAVEIMQDGSVYIKGVGNYDGKSITTADLKSLQQVIADSASIDVDDAFSTTSENPLQNKVITDRVSFISKDTSNNVTLSPDGSLILKSTNDCNITVANSADDALIDVDTEDSLITVDVSNIDITSDSFTFNGSDVATVTDLDFLKRQISILINAVNYYHAGGDDEIEIVAQPVVTVTLPELTDGTVYHGPTTVTLTKAAFSLDGTTALAANSGTLVLETIDMTAGTVTQSNIATGIDIAAGTVTFSTPATFTTAENCKYRFRVKYQDAKGNEYSYLIDTRISCDKAVNPFYVGMVDGTKAAFAALTDAQLKAAAQQYQYVNEVNTAVSKYIYFLMLPADLTFKSVTYVDEGLETVINDLTTFNAPHADAVIDGITYSVYGYRIAPNDTPLNYKLQLS